jgi:hypothetical protein
MTCLQAKWGGPLIGILPMRIHSYFVSSNTGVNSPHNIGKFLQSYALVKGYSECRMSQLTKLYVILEKWDSKIWGDLKYPKQISLHR